MLTIEQARVIDGILPMRFSAEAMVEKWYQRHQPREACRHPNKHYENGYDEWYCPDCCVQWPASIEDVADCGRMVC